MDHSDFWHGFHFARDLMGTFVNDDKEMRDRIGDSLFTYAGAMDAPRRDILVGAIWGVLAIARMGFDQLAQYQGRDPAEVIQEALTRIAAQEGPPYQPPEGAK